MQNNIRTENLHILNKEHSQLSTIKALFWLAVTLTLLGLGFLAYYALSGNSDESYTTEIPTIRAENTVYKIPPQDQQETIQNMDKKIYDTISSSKNISNEISATIRNKATSLADKQFYDYEEPVSREFLSNVGKTANSMGGASNEDSSHIKGNTENLTTNANNVMKATINDTEKAVNEPGSKSKQTLTASKTKGQDSSTVLTKTEPSVAKTLPDDQVTQKAVKIEVKKQEQNKKAGNKKRRIYGRNYKVQLGAFKAAQDARKAWANLNRKHSKLLSSYTARIQKVMIGDKTLYRLQAGTLKSKSAANKLCATLKKHKQDCFIVAE